MHQVSATSCEPRFNHRDKKQSE
uniref:Uncharacterized protein n=1 Tax=Arundo donax TaxID=35708 RepID=A0A0A8ZDF2_ARUDO